MRYLLLLLFSAQCWAEAYHFTFKMGEDNLEFDTVAETRNEALETAGEFCGKFFGVGIKDLTEDQIAEIIDACANPRP